MKIEKNLPNWFFEIESYMDSMVYKERYTRRSADIYLSSLSKICTVLRDEPELISVQSFLSNIKTISDLFYKKTYKKKLTIKYYINRSRNMLTEYLSHQIIVGKSETVRDNINTQNSWQFFQGNSENITVVELTKSFLQFLLKCSGELSPELAQKLFINLLPYCSKINQEAYLEFLLKISKTIKVIEWSYINKTLVPTFLD